MLSSRKLVFCIPDSSRMKKLLSLLLAVACVGLSPAQRIDRDVAGDSPRRVFLMDKDWKFHRGHLDQPKPEGHHWVYKSVKAGAARGPAAFQYDTARWRTVNLPHDYVVEGRFRQDPTLVSHGFLDRPEGWYRRQFLLPEEARGQSIWLYFDGVFGQSQVWVNGQELRRSDNGYIGFRVDISDVAHYGGMPNVIAVRCDPGEAQGWWYEGGGIYRHVWLTLAEPIHVAPYGTYVCADKKEGGQWLVELQTTLENEAKADARVTVVNAVLDAQGHELARVSQEVDAQAGRSVELRQQLAIPEEQVKPWDVDSPNLYGIRTCLYVDGRLVDASGDRFGFRTLEFDAQKGFSLNGKPLKFKGVCMHQDHAGVGVALPDALHRFRVARLKQFGVNAYRCSHNPPAPEILDACDSLGMLVLNENRFFNSSEECLRQLDEQVRRDRNHPSVMMWNTFNEEDWQGDERGARMVERMKRTILAADHFARRPVTGAMSGGFSREGAFEPLDVLGINYNLGANDYTHHQLYPDRMVYSSESVSHSASRGEWKDRRHVFNNYDNHWVDWGDSIRNTWRFVDTREWNGGTFIWTGFDYRGEPTPVNAWPAISSYFGIVDTCGFAKDSYYLMKALWTQEPMAYVFPHWNLGRDMVGRKVKVGTYTNGDEAELFLNGRSLGRRKVDKYMQLFWDDVVYEPGTLEVVAYREGREHARHRVETTGCPVALGLEVCFEDWKRESVRTSEGDALPVTIFAVDAAGRRVPTAQNRVHVSVSGGRVLGMGNGNPLCHEPDAATSRSLYNGLATAIVAPGEQEGQLEILATAQGLKPARLTLPILRGAGFAQYAAMEGVVITDWRMSAVTDEPLNPNRPIADGDMNTWQPVTVGDGPQPQWAQKLGWATCRARFEMPHGKGWELVLEDVVGAAEVYINGERVAARETPEAGTLRAPVHARAGSEVTVSVQLHATHANSGLTGVVRLEAAR